MLTTTIRGRFVSVQFKSWSGFTASDGKEVKPGNSARAFVLDNEANEVRTINVSDIDRATLDRMKFGDEVAVSAEVRSYKSGEFSFRALQFQAVKAPAAA